MRNHFTSRASSILLLCVAISLPALAHPHDRLEWAISEGDHHTMVSSSHAGHRAVEQLQRRIDVPFVWLRHEGQEYVITDPATVRKARTILEDLAEIDDFDLEVEIDTEELEQTIERELETEMEKFELRMEELEEQIEAGSFAALEELDDVISEIEIDRIEEIAARIARETVQIEEMTGRIEDWARDLEERIDEQAIPLFEDAIRSGLAKPVR